MWMYTRKSTRVRHVGFRWAHAHGALYAVAMATADNMIRNWGEPQASYGTMKSRHPVSLIQCGPSSQFVFELVSRDCCVIVSPHSHFSCLSLFTSLFITLSLYHNYTLSRIHLLPSSAHVTVQSGTPCETPWIRDVTLLFFSLLFPPFSLLTLATERRVLHGLFMLFFDTFTPRSEVCSRRMGLEVKQVWLTS